MTPRELKNHVKMTKINVFNAKIYTVSTFQKDVKAMENDFKTFESMKTSAKSTKIMLKFPTAMTKPTKNC